MYVLRGQDYYFLTQVEGFAQLLIVLIIWREGKMVFNQKKRMERKQMVFTEIVVLLDY